METEQLSYSGAERLRAALEKLEDFFATGGMGVAGEAGSPENGEQLTALKNENEALLHKQKQVRQRLDKLITLVQKHVETAEEGNQ